MGEPGSLGEGTSDGRDAVTFGSLLQSRERKKKPSDALKRIGSSPAPLLRVVVVGAETLRVLIFGEEKPLTQVRFNVVNVRGDHSSPFLRTTATIWLLSEPMPFDRFPSR